MKPARFLSTSMTARVLTFLTRCASFFRSSVCRSGLDAASSGEVALPVATELRFLYPGLGLFVGRGAQLGYSAK